MEKEAHLLELCRYVVLNPVRAGLVKRPEEWRGSSYRATVGEAKKPVFWKLIGFFRSLGVGVQRRKRRTGDMYWKNSKESRLGKG